MPFNGSGVFTRLYSWVADRDSGVNITASRMDADENDLAQGLMHCLTIDGQTRPIANLPMGGYRHTGAAPGVAATDYATIGQLTGGTTGGIALSGTSLTVTGNATISGTTTLGSTTATGLSAGSIVATGLSAGASTLDALTVNHDATVVGVMTAAGATVGNRGLQVNGTVVVNGTSNFTQPLTAQAMTATSLTLSGAFSAASLAAGTVHATTLIADANCTVGSLSVTNDATIGGTVYSGAVQSTGAMYGAALSVSGVCNVGTNLFVAGTGSVQGAFSAGSLHSNGGIYAGGLLQANGGVTVLPPAGGGDAIVITGAIGAPSGTGGLTVHNGMTIVPDAGQSNCLNLYGAINFVGAYPIIRVPVGAGGLQVNGGMVVTPDSGQSQALYVTADVKTDGGFFCATGITPVSDASSSCGNVGRAWVSVYAYNHITPSDQVLKRAIAAPPAGALALVEQLETAEFEWQHEAPGMPRHRGFIAQEVRRILGRSFAGVVEDEGELGLVYDELTAVLWQAVRELAGHTRELARGLEAARRRPA